MDVEVALRTPLANAISNVVQPKLVEVGWSSGGSDDSTLCEYILLMLVNGKKKEQIASELANDLLALSPDDNAAVEFADWLFDQVHALNAQLNGGNTSTPQLAPNSNSHTSESQERISESTGGAANHDTEMIDGANGADRSAVPNASSMIPTGPKSMRGGNGQGNQKTRDRRMFGQLNKALDRSGEGTLHRIRGTSGTGRINGRAREQPKGFKDLSRNQGVPVQPRAMGNATPGNMSGVTGAIMSMSPQQQMQMFAFYEQQARIMSEVLSPQQQQQMFGALPNGGSMNEGGGRGHTQPNRSLFDRVEKRGTRMHTSRAGDGNESSNKEAGAVHSNATSTMEVDASQPPNAAEGNSPIEGHKQQKDTTEIICRFNLLCTRPDCPYVHQSPAAPPGITIDIKDVCSYGPACKNKKCAGKHPSPAQKTSHQTEQDCKFYPNCANPACPFRHPDMPPCRNGADCTVSGCKFGHSKVMCKFNPCLNPACPYKHKEGQKRGSYEDKVWTPEKALDASAGGSATETHISERKFVDDNAPEELIVPGNAVAQDTIAQVEP